MSHDVRVIHFIAMKPPNIFGRDMLFLLTLDVLWELCGQQTSTLIVAIYVGQIFGPLALVFGLCSGELSPALFAESVSKGVFPR
jgi:hypothetical protein